MKRYYPIIRRGGLSHNSEQNQPRRAESHSGTRNGLGQGGCLVAGKQ